MVSFGRGLLLRRGLGLGLFVALVVASLAGSGRSDGRGASAVREKIAHWVDVGTCASIQNEQRSPRVVAPNYPLGFVVRAQLIAYISCREAGPGSYYMRFVSHAALAAALRAYPQVQRKGLCVLNHEMLDDDSLDPLPLGRFCRRLHGRLLPLTPGKRGYQAPPMTDNSTCADYLKATKLDQADYVARQRPFSERRDTRDPRIVAAAAHVAKVCDLARRHGKARNTRLYSAMTKALGG